MFYKWQFISSTHDSITKKVKFFPLRDSRQKSLIIPKIKKNNKKELVQHSAFKKNVEEISRRCMRQHMNKKSAQMKLSMHDCQKTSTSVLRP
ncbi:hypothetical protein BpHYR1_001175 [Brachionus plicatilis]|uniref:Uncharacterized protein n=1 Tax=Brachionus plicatilis TaxID=10195 RepID=A0A3M7RMN1_BRAPC|nr:hypothetical protein BpHYR1_001175 [Brachionus plicatilis]